MNKLILMSFTIFSFSLSSQADEIIMDDLIVSGGSVCVGVDCIDGEVFDFDTIKLKTDDPLIKFEDTSSSASFPTNDWSIGITDNGATDPALFFINDVSGGSNVLVMEAESNGGVALGAGSTLEANAISVGSAGAERRIINLADGSTDSDAATIAQLNAFKTLHEDELSSLEIALDALTTRLDGVINRLNGL